MNPQLLRLEVFDGSLLFGYCNHILNSMRFCVSKQILYLLYCRDLRYNLGLHTELLYVGFLDLEINCAYIRLPVHRLLTPEQARQ
jgi:hypothetical protein